MPTIVIQSRVASTAMLLSQPAVLLCQAQHCLFTRPYACMHQGVAGGGEGGSEAVGPLSAGLLGTTWMGGSCEVNAGIYRFLFVVVSQYCFAW